MSVHKSKEKKWKSHIFEIFFVKMGTSPKSSIFSTVGSRTSTQRRGSAIGTTIGKHNGGGKTGNKREKWKVKKTKEYLPFLFFKLL